MGLLTRLVNSLPNVSPITINGLSYISIIAQYSMENFPSCVKFVFSNIPVLVFACVLKTITLLQQLPPSFPKTV